MHILALAVDYDGTIAKNGSVDDNTIDALLRLKHSGRKLLLVTGRQLVDLQHACRHLELFDYIIAENGAVLLVPATGQSITVAPPPSTDLIRLLAEHSSMPISLGQSIIAGWHPDEHAAMNVIRDLGLELQIIFNKDAFMVLPVNVSKSTGLLHALKDLDICALNVAGCGDAENDHCFLSICGCSAAVANALPSVKSAVDIVLRADHGEGVVEFIERILKEDDMMLPIARRGVKVAMDHSGTPFHLRPEDIVLVVGNSGCGKSSFLTLLTEKMSAAGHEFCVIDPEGDYLGLKNAVSIGSLDSAPSTEDAIQLLLRAGINVVVNTVALDVAGRRKLFRELMMSIRALRMRSGRPQWLIVDEAHYALPYPGEGLKGFDLQSGAIIATVDPGTIASDILKQLDVAIVMGSTATELVTRIASLIGRPATSTIPNLEAGDFLVWSGLVGTDSPSFHVLEKEQPEQIHNRHHGKYATGDVGRQRSFYFPDADRHARNLLEFLLALEKIDDTAWSKHLKAHDFSNWFRNVIRDDSLADQAVQIEGDAQLTALQSRCRIIEAVRQRYTF